MLSFHTLRHSGICNNVPINNIEVLQTKVKPTRELIVTDSRKNT